MSIGYQITRTCRLKILVSGLQIIESKDIKSWVVDQRGYIERPLGDVQYIPNVAKDI